jgi:hypothetical protein
MPTAFQQSVQQHRKHAGVTPLDLTIRRLHDAWKNVLLWNQFSVTITASSIAGHAPLLVRRRTPLQGFIITRRPGKW